MERAQRFVSVVLLILSVIYLVASLRLPLGNASEPGKGLLPAAIGVFAVFLAALLVIEVFFFRKDAHAQKSELFSQLKDEFGEGFPGGRDLYRLLGVLVFVGFYGFFFGTLGFLLTTGISTAGVLRLLGMRSWMQIILFSVLTSGCSYYLFGVILGVPLPQGVFPS